MKGDGSGGSGNDPAKKKRYKRHTARQIQEMEALFEETHYLNDKQKGKLSQNFGLSVLQINNWFQNRRAQFKAKQERLKNVMMLRAENKTLKTESYNLQSDLQCQSCPCGSSGDENSSICQEIDRLCNIAWLMNHHPSLPPPQDNIFCFFPESYNNVDLLLREEAKAIARDLAVSYVQELVKMCDANEPLWHKKKSDDYGDRCIRREVSRVSSVVLMNSKTLVNTFLDADKWMEMFCSIVSKAETVQIISSGVCGANGSLLLMYAELQALTPLIPTRKAYFLRYAEQEVEQGKWVIVDFPMIDNLTKQPSTSATSSNQYRRKPSGCIIQDIPNGYSKVTWVEHVEVEEEEEKKHEAVREYVKSGVAFGADRWLAVLKRQCERMVSFMATNNKDLGVIEWRKNLMKLSERMVRTFCLNISDSNRQVLFESTRKDLVRITPRNVFGGFILCAVSTTFLPYSHYQVFDLLRDNHRRSELEILFNGSSFQEVANIANGSHPGNCISLLRNDVEFMLQETCIDNSGGLVVYSTVVFEAVQLDINGNDQSSIVPLFPFGFSVVPMNPKDGAEGISVNSPSCLFTVVIHVNAKTAKPDISTIAAIDNRICSTVNKITSALSHSAAGN